MSFGRRLERSDTINERNDDKKSSNSKGSWQNEIKLDDDIGEWKNEIKLDDDMKSPSKESYADVLESYIIDTESANEAMVDKIVDIELPKQVKIKFFNKEWTLPVEIAKYSGPINGANAARLIAGFTKNAEEISKKMEKSFCRMCQQDLNEIGFDKTIKSYSDLQSGCPLPAFRLKPGVLYITTDHNKKTILAILGEYPINDHGWGFQYSGGSYAGLVPDSGYYL